MAVGRNIRLPVVLPNLSVENEKSRPWDKQVDVGAVAFVTDIADAEGNKSLRRCSRCSTGVRSVNESQGWIQ